MERNIFDLFDKKYNGEDIDIISILGCTIEEYDAYLKEYLSIKENERLKEKGLTGFASVDKPWEKFYRSEPIKDIKVDQTIYEMVFDNNPKAEAIGYMGRTYTFGELKELVDRCADAFVKDGIGLGDVVLVGVSNSPEAVITLLALNKIGAVSKWFDIRASENDIKQYYKISNCKAIVAFDMLIPKIELVREEANIDKVYYASPFDSLPILLKGAAKLKAIKDKETVDIPDSDVYQSFESFIKKGSKNSSVPVARFDANRPSVMIQSSGTTGKPKTIVHSDLSATSCTHKIAYSDLPLGKGKKVLVALPPWIAYGIGNAIVLPLSLGSKVELSPKFDPDTVYKYIGKFTLSFAAPFHYRYLKEKYEELSPRKKAKLASVDCMISGGDKISIEENKAFEETFDTILVNGYGNNESWGALTVNSTLHNRYGSVGIPKYGDVIMSYDNETGQELPYGKVGEICSLTDTAFLRYEGNEVETQNILREHNGQVWVHTGDYGSIDEDGYVYLGGRARRVIVRLGFKISAYTIEDKITEMPEVKECVVVAVPDETEEQVPIAYVVLKNQNIYDTELIEEDIRNKCISELKEYEVPKYIRIVRKLPYTDNGKYDFLFLEHDAVDYVSGISVKKLKREIK